MSEQHIEHLKQHFVNTGRPKIIEVIEANRHFIDPDNEANISTADLDQALARLRDAKEAKAAGSIDPQEYRAIKTEVARVRQVHRLQENAAGRRGLGIIGGDAVISGV